MDPVPPPLDVSLESPEEPSADIHQANERGQSNNRDTHTCEQFIGVFVDRSVSNKERHAEQCTFEDFPICASFIPTCSLVDDLYEFLRSSPLKYPWVAHDS